ncbi:MAG: hypothetical protein V3S55_15400 [Nitrospiraceae bacterium]
MSNNLGRVETTAAQDQKTVTLNTSDEVLDAAVTELTALVVDNTNLITVSSVEAQTALVLQFNDDASPPTEAVVVTYPAVQRGLFAVFNNMTFALSVGISGQGGTFPILSVGETRLLQCDGVNVSEISSAAPEHHGALVNITGTQSISDVTDTFIAWDAEIYDHPAGPNQFWLGINATITTDFATDDIIDLTTHGMQTADGPFQFTTTTTLPAGISLATDYFAIRVSDNEFEIALSISDAIAGTQVDITDDGTGTHTIDRETRLVVPQNVTQVRLKGAIEMVANATGERLLEIKKNGSAVVGGGAHSQQGNANDNFMTVESATLVVTPGDFFDLEIFQNSTASQNLLNANSKTWFSIEEVRP